MNESKQPSGEEVVDETASHYKVEKLANGTVRVSSGGRVVVRPTYYEALQAFAEWGQECVEESADNLRMGERETIYHDTTNPELDGVIENDAEWIKDEVIDDVMNGDTTISRSGAWLAERRPERGDDVLGDAVNVYRLWDTRWSNGER